MILASSVRGLFAQFEAGQVIEKIPCESDSSLSYTLYLPSKYSTEKQWPVIYFFEPAARGTLPLNKYKEIAENHRVVLICSNASRNGLHINESFRIAKNVFEDSQKKLNINRERIFLSGFSGGSRLAFTLSIHYPETKGVIGIGALSPVPGISIPDKLDVLYAGIVGVRDMNYQEHKKGVQILDEKKIRNLLIINTNDHSWAPQEDFELALEWMLLELGDSPRLDLEEDISTRIRNTNDSIPKVDLIPLLNLLSEDQKSSFEPTSIKELKKAIKTQEMEFEFMKQISDSINAAIYFPHLHPNTLGWLQSTATILQKRSESSRNLQAALMSLRVLNYLKASAFERQRSFYQIENYSQALIAISILEFSKDDNPWILYLKARVKARLTEFDEALMLLIQFQHTNLLTRKMLLSEEAFNPMQTMVAFQRLVDSIESN